MEILICQTCGNLLRSEDTLCSNCSTPISQFAATAMPMLANAKPVQAASNALPTAVAVNASASTFASNVASAAAVSNGPNAQIVQNTAPTQSNDFFAAAPAQPRQEFAFNEPPARQNLTLNEGTKEANALSDLLVSRSSESDPKPRSIARRSSTRIGAVEEKKSKKLSRKENKQETKTEKLDLDISAFLPNGRDKVIAIAAAVVCTCFIAFGFFLGTMASRVNAPEPAAQGAAAFPNLMNSFDTPKVGGMYKVHCANSTVDRSNWDLMLNRDGTTLSAMSANNGKSWRIQGQFVSPNQIRLEKQFYSNGLKDGYPVVYSAQIQKDQLGKFHLNGTFTSRAKVFKLRQQIATVEGKWFANQSISEDVLKQGGFGQLPQTKPITITAPSTNVLTYFLQCLDPNSGLSRKEISDRLMMLAAVMVGIGILIATCMLWIFNPHGKLNRMSKEEYIPSQYKSQHNKMVREWAKPIKRGSVPLGTRAEWRIWKPWVPKTMAMTPDSRAENPHMIVMGGSDKGKTRLLANMVCHDIESADRAVVVIDSDGELTELVSKWAAAHPKGSELSKRVMIIDPTYKGGFISYNPLEPLDNVNFIDAASAIVHGFKAIYTEPQGSQSQWSQQTANILRNAAILLMANNKTLVDLPTLLQDNDFRDILLEGVERKRNERTEYATLIDSWGQYKKLARTDQWITWVEPILNRVTPMLSDPRIRPILTKPVSDLRLQDLIEHKQVLLVRIPQGQLDQNANLLGSLIVTGIKQAAMSLSDDDEDAQNPCSIYLDEMNNFIEKETIEALTQETDKFKIAFIGCCKTLQHLPEDFRNQIIINVGTLLAFALAKKDADTIGPQMFRVDGRKIKHRTIGNFFNQVNTSPTFELISDEEKLNIDRVVGQEQRNFFCYRVGSVAGTFKLKSHDFADPPKAKVRKKLLEDMHSI